MVYTYALLRFVAGVGLAGELGAGITLVSESLPKELRAIGTSVVAGFGLMGAVVAQLTVELSGGWNISYIIGGGLGILLLFLRISVSESGIYKNIKHQSVSKGNFLFFTNKDRLIRYLKCIAVGLPTWYCIGILAVLANQFAPELGIKEINPGKAIMWGYVGISVGDLMSGFISQMLKSRKKLFLYVAFHHCRGRNNVIREYKYGNKILCILCMAGTWNRLLGNVCYTGCGAVWHQYPKYSNHYSA